MKKYLAGAVVGFVISSAIDYVLWRNWVNKLKEDIPKLAEEALADAKCRGVL